MADVTHTFLFGDPELDRCVPSFPRVIPEVTWTQIDGTRLLAISGLASLLIPARSGRLEVLEFLNTLDGSKTIREILVGGSAEIESRRSILKLLFKHGMLEQNPLFQTFESSPIRSFLAFAMDQTRLCNGREDAFDRSTMPIRVLGAGAGVRDELKNLGLNLTDDPDASLHVVFVSDSRSIDRDVSELRLQGKLVLLVSFRGTQLDIGPLINGAGSCSLQDYRNYTAGLQFDLPESVHELWTAFVGQAIFLLLSRTCPVSLVNKVLRYTYEQGGLCSDTIPVPRFCADQDAPAGIVPADGLARLLRQSRLSVPPPYIAGTKVHEVHYSRRNVAAAFEIPTCSDAKLTVKPYEDSFFNGLVETVDRVFGYKQHLDGQMTRNCPSGGNLGSPECLLVTRDRHSGAASVYRYIPINRAFECVTSGGTLALSFRSRGFEFTLVCLGNIEKTQRKYGDFGLNLARIDSGIARSFAEQASAAFSLRFDFSDDETLPPEIARLIAGRDDSYTVMWTAVVRDRLPALFAGLSRAGAKAKAFDQLATKRRSVRQFSGLKLGVRQMAAALRRACPRPLDTVQRELLRRLRPILSVRSNGLSGTFEYLQSGTLELLPEAEAKVHKNLDVINQTMLSQAPSRIFFLVDLTEVVREFGAEGHDKLLQITGAWVGSFWLQLQALGHGGCPAGAAVESELLKELPLRFSKCYLLFTFVFGHPVKTVS